MAYAGTGNWFLSLLVSLLGGYLPVAYIRGAEIQLLPYAISEIKDNVVDLEDIHAVRGESRNQRWSWEPDNLGI